MNSDNRNKVRIHQVAFDIVSSGYRNRHLILRLTRREILAKYRGSLLGLVWAGLNPLLLLAVYTFVFSGVFHMRWGQTTGSTGEFALLVFSGMILFNFLAECLSRAPSLLLENVSYIKKVVFPLEVLPVVQIIVALFGALISFCILAVFYPLVFGLPPATILLLPLTLLPTLLLVAGLSWFLASLGVFLRDVRQMIGLVVTVIMFMSPVFYPVAMVPEPYRTLLLFGPLSVPLEAMQDVMFWGRLPPWLPFTAYTAVSVLVAMVGYWWFMRTRKAFADVV